MEFGDDGLRLAAGGDEVGSAEEELACELDGAPLTIAFNPGYLLDALGALHTAGPADVHHAEPARAGAPGHGASTPSPRAGDGCGPLQRRVTCTC